MWLAALILALLVSGSTLALARGAHVEAHASINSQKGNPALGGPWPSSTAVGGMPNPSGAFNPSGVGVPGGSGPGNTTVMPNMTPPPPVAAPALR